LCGETGAGPGAVMLTMAAPNKQKHLPIQVYRMLLFLLKKLPKTKCLNEHNSQDRYNFDTFCEKYIDFLLFSFGHFLLLMLSLGGQKRPKPS
jgi:hypothetical protein